MSEAEKSSGSVHSSEMSSIISEVVRSSSGSSSSSGGGDPDGGGGGGGDSSGGTGGGCPDISSISVAVFRIGDHEPPEDDLCFVEDVLTGCAVVVSFVVAPFDEVCYNHLIARVTLAGSVKTVAIYNVGGVYQVDWGFEGLPDLDLFPDTVYEVSICIEPTVGTPEECVIPEDCCETQQWTSPEICCCNPSEDGTTCGELPCCCEPNWAPIGADCKCVYVGP